MSSQYTLESRAKTIKAAIVEFRNHDRFEDRPLLFLLLVMELLEDLIHEIQTAK